MRPLSWLRHFNLEQPPFDKDVVDSALWLPTSKASVVERLVEAVEEHQHVLLTGEPGVGKTCTLRALRHRLPEAGFRLTYCSNATLGRRDFYRQLCHALGLSPKATAAAVFTAVNEHVEDLGRERIHPVFLLDEAHLLRQDVLEHLHVLANYQWDQKPLLTLVLVGLPELWARLRLHKNRSLWSRIHCRVAIDDPAPEDTVEYVAYRLRCAGTERQLFTSDALSVLHEGTSGILRDIDRVAGNALRTAARRKLKEVDRSIVSAVLAEEN
jgi:general secretion pathway protein A